MAEPTALWLIRHGAHGLLDRVLCGRMAGVCLSEEGRAQARAAGERLRGEALRALYCGPLERVRQTAEGIAREVGLAPRVADELDEIDVGAWTGATFASLRADPRWRAWNAERGRARAADGETMAQVGARVDAFLARARRDHAGEVIGAVSHGDVIKAAVARVLDLPFDRLDRFEIGPGSLSLLALADWGSRLVRLNESPR